MSEDRLPPKPAKRPCGSCPYRRDVPSGVWSLEDYAKLPRYDKETWEQPTGVFLCHQRDGHVCAGWLQTHGTDDLLALRMNEVDPSCFDFSSDVETFDSGVEAAVHGVRDIRNPGPEAQAMMEKLRKLPGL